MTGIAAAGSREHVSSRCSALRRRSLVIAAIVIAAALGLTYSSLAFGAVTLSPSEVVGGLTSSSDVFARTVVWEIRFPRLLDAVVVGASLAVAGSLLQGVTRNPLGDPTILGLTAATGLASALTLVLFPGAPQTAMAAMSCAGALVGGSLLFVIAWRGQVSPVRLALSGVALSAFFGAIIIGLLSSSRTFIQTSVGFLAGGLYGGGWSDLYAALPYAAAGFALAIFFSGRLNILALGDDVASGLGILTDRTRFGVLVAAGLLTAAAVSIAGLVSFVGLLCPHLARFTVGSDNRLAIPLSALYGALLVVAADLFARMVISPAEIPFGIVTAGLGAPFLLYLVRVRG
ncbi:MAG: iron ABC transporter permease [Dehalococcoidia bacterium]|nr:iron ABC transporter permease [Dehalococcoidia bacterium]